MLPYSFVPETAERADLADWQTGRYRLGVFPRMIHPRCFLIPLHLAMSRELLLEDTNCILSDLVAAIGSAESVLRVPDLARLRVVAFRDSQKRLIPAAMLLEVGVEQTWAGEKVIDAEGTYLFDLSIPARVLGEMEGLQQFLESWPQRIRGGRMAVTYGCEDHVQLYRRGSGTGGSPFPFWQATLNGDVEGSQYAYPRRHVFSHTYEFFADSIGEAASRWLEDPNLKGYSSPRRGIDLRLFDRRAALSSVGVENGTLVVRVAQSVALDFHCVADFQIGLQHDGVREHCSVAAPSVQLPVPPGATSYRVHLLGNDGRRYDERSGSVPDARRGQRVAIASRPPVALRTPRSIGTLGLIAAHGVGSFIDTSRIDELREPNSRFDTTRLVRMCEELNTCYDAGCYFAVATLTRAIIDHVPPIFGASTFTDVANHHGGRSFKSLMNRLDAVARKVADSHLHQQIRGQEVLPTATQVNFSPELDVLLGEIVRALGDTK
jgi:hypothetical protein